MTRVRPAPPEQGIDLDCPGSSPLVIGQPFDAIAAARFDLLQNRIDHYDPSTSGDIRLHDHQVEAVERFREVAGTILRREVPNAGMAILHPTGSGKTGSAVEIARMLGEDGGHGLDPTNALMLVPGHRILQQTRRRDGTGAISTHAPGLHATEYSGRKKEIGRVTVMTYQALRYAIDGGAIDRMDPGLIICDEAHHVIDRSWAQQVASIAGNRLLLGLTATPAYSSTREISSMFPNVLSRITMKEGIERRMLSGVQGFLYKGESRISIPRMKSDYPEKELFEAIANSADNFLAARICAREVAMGRRGIVPCVPGHDRAHAKIMADILSKMMIDTPKGRRRMKATHVDSGMASREIDKIFDNYRRGKLDVITYVDLINEGWDSPETDFAVLMRPTAHRLLAEQRIGRILRKRDGKTATLHELVYQIDGGPGQVMHVDILERNKVEQGYKYGPSSEVEAGEEGARSEGDVNLEDFSIDPELAGRLSELDGSPVEEVRILCGQDSLPDEWQTRDALSARFGISEQEIEEILAGAEAPFRSSEADGTESVYYSPRAPFIIAEYLGLKPRPAGSLTIMDLLRYHNSTQTYGRVSRSSLERALKADGQNPTEYLTLGGHVVKAYSAETKDIVPHNGHSVKEANKPEAKEEPKDVLQIVSEWLDGILVSPKDAGTVLRQREIVTAQSALLASISKLDRVPADALKVLKHKIKSLKLKPTPSMIKVMESKGIEFAALIIAAGNARADVVKMEAANTYSMNKKRSRK